ncbi:MAG TPA: DUF5011 domain-containing protein, partial [Candidatus Hydrogenedentes bacterium]|nr:DUF5011 domain-containing protein [Candidatus Hydrogenedentota bacterium]
DLTGSIVAVSNVNVDVVGSYTVTYDVTDAAGNAAVQVVRTVNVVDTTAPVITLLGASPVTVEVHNAYSDAGATALDNYDGDLTGSIVAVSNVNVDVVGAYTVTYDVTDAAGNAASQVVRVVHVVDTTAPVVSLVNATPNPVAVSKPFTVTAHIDDLGTNVVSAEYSLDEGLTWKPMDAIAQPALSVVATVSVSGLSTTGIYTISVRGVDASGNVSEPESIFLPVYDPNGGFVTGGGWINSPAGAYAPNPALTGKANFGFVSKYQKGSNVPTGQTEFQFKAGDLNFHSSSYEWLVCAGSKATYKGVGTINGQGSYKFFLSAIDGNLKAKGAPDTFRIRIYSEAGGVETAIYDNLLGAQMDADPTTVLGGGSIVIQSSK